MISYSDASATFANAGNMSVFVFRTPMTMAILRALRHEVVRLQQQYGSDRASITIVESEAMVSPDDSVRAEATALSHQYGSSFDATVLEGTGFRAAAVRAVMSGISLLGGRAAKRRTFASLDGALDAVMATGRINLSRPELLALVAEARGST